MPLFRVRRLQPSWGVIQVPVDEYEKKVREIAVAQCRCSTGADIKTDLPKDGHAPQEHAQAA